MRLLCSSFVSWWVETQHVQRMQGKGAQTRYKRATSQILAWAFSPYPLKSLFCYFPFISRLNALTEKGKFDSKIIEYCNMAINSSVENSICINKVWVQCENESCLKWRLLSNEDKAKVNHNEPWYCFMNTDSKYNKCSVSEEDFPEESQLHQNGYRIVYSQLPLGSLVLVKLQNWPR